MQSASPSRWTARPNCRTRRRVYKNGKGSYAVMEPRLRKLIAGHKTRAVTARVTLSAGVT